MVDVVPFVPLGDTTRAEAEAARDRFLTWIADEGPEIRANERISMSQASLKTRRSAYVNAPRAVAVVMAARN